MEKVSIVFVCMGNICRSPTAEGVFRHLVEEAGLSGEISIDSAGTHAYHVGASADSRARAAAASRGYDLTAMRARKIVDEDFERFDYVIAMDQDNLDLLKAQAGEMTKAKLNLFLDFAAGDLTEVPDPYYGGVAGFEKVLDLVEEASRGLLEMLSRKNS